VTSSSFFVRTAMLAVIGVASVSSPARPGDAGDAAWRILLVPAITPMKIVPHKAPAPQLHSMTVQPHELAAHSLPDSTVRLAACPREYEPVSFAIHADKPLTNIRVTAGDLKSGGGGGGSIPASAIDIRVVQVWYQAGTWLYVRKEKPLLTPELLLKDDRLVRIDTEKKVNILKMAKDAMRDADVLQPFDVQADTVKQVWVTVHVPADAKAGTYRGTIVVQPQGEDAIGIPVELRVLPFQLDEPNVICSMYYRGHTHRQPGNRLTTYEKTEEQLLADLKDMFAHGVTNPMTYSHPIGPKENGSYDFTHLQRLFELRKQAGMSGGPLLMQNVSIQSPPELLKAMIAFAKKHGFTDVYFSAADEAKGDALVSQRAAMRQVHEIGGKIFVASYAYDSFQLVGDLLDMPVLAGPIAIDGTQLAAYRASGGQVLSYASPQGGIEEPILYRRNYGLVLWEAGYSGACTYAYQHAFGHAWDDFDDGHWRDHIMAYPTVDGVIPTVQWEGYREGYDDLRYMATLENLIEKNWRLDGPAGEAARVAREWLLHLDPTDPHTTMDAVRTTLIDQLVAHDRIKDHEYFAAQLVERGYERRAVSRQGHVTGDTDPRAGVASFEPKSFPFDNPHTSIVLDLGAVKQIDVIQLYTAARLERNNVNLDGTSLELYCSDDNASYRRIPFTYRDVDMRVVELADIREEGRYFKVTFSLTPVYDTASIRHRYIEDATPDGMVNPRRTIRHDPNGTVPTGQCRFYLGADQGGAQAFVRKP